ncbi:alpha/beta fold hydrolase [Kitasatospora viridis]|uniref:Alpha-beta hydrolase superfamily lysophospholipase n=1 Tax=Kitasatospora viridis TaxID=281105 RepID=A0A561UNK4_9ACTN|nr:alpha/beta hydrolase [Kitasatospora viridis]TWG00914.1 alpha-beta hydrolase superfamily lysophospholipase [Kitasatospora viridis]
MSSTFVLVPGYWLGAWAWEGVAGPLRERGHRVHAVSLPGLAERAGEGGPEVDLEAHTADLVRLLAGLDQVVLVAHSGAGAPVSVAADRVPEKLRRVVYLDSGPLADGMSALDQGGAAKRERIEASVLDGWRYPMPSWERLAADGASTEGLDAARLAAVRERATDQPIGALRQPAHRTGGAAALPKTLVSCSFPLDQVRAMIAQGHPFFAELAGPEWDFAELSTGHWPMFSRPADTADLLAELAGRGTA